LLNALSSIEFSILGLVLQRLRNSLDPTGRISVKFETKLVTSLSMRPVAGPDALETGRRPVLVGRRRGWETLHRRPTRNRQRRVFGPALAMDEARALGASASKNSPNSLWNQNLASLVVSLRRVESPSLDPPFHRRLDGTTSAAETVAALLRRAPGDVGDRAPIPRDARMLHLGGRHVLRRGSMRTAPGRTVGSRLIDGGRPQRADAKSMAAGQTPTARPSAADVKPAADAAVNRSRRHGRHPTRHRRGPRISS
jgi:hypothetical protein